MTPEEAAGSRAVLFGVHSFKRLGDLDGVRHNVAALRELLIASDVGGFAEENCVAVPPDSAPNALLDAVQDATEEATHLVLIYYAGHGHFGGQSGQSLLLATAASDLRRPYHSVPYGQIREMVARSRARYRIVIADCCFSGLALHMGDDAATDAAKTFKIEGACVLASAAETQRSLCLPEGSVFTLELAALLREGLRGLLHDGRRGEDQPTLTMADVFDSLAARLKDRTVQGHRVPQPRMSTRENGYRIPLALNRAFSKSVDDNRKKEKRSEGGAKKEKRDTGRTQSLAVVTPITVAKLRRQWSLKSFTGILVHNSPEYRKVNEALRAVESEFESACRHHGVSVSALRKLVSDGKGRLGREIAQKTGDLRWAIVGENVYKLCKVGYVMYGGGNIGASVPAMIPTTETAYSFAANAAIVIEQIRGLLAEDGAT
ncbi:caspase family protein [Streptomyces sp. NPDC002952]|uniref:caspase, EACC1-associated type n=1 Tax=Streptomyces sp. NPDC002952 TaxID=3364673 RepID=UPI0036A8541C